MRALPLSLCACFLLACSAKHNGANGQDGGPGTTTGGTGSKSGSAATSGGRVGSGTGGGASSMTGTGGTGRSGTGGTTGTNGTGGSTSASGTGGSNSSGTGGHGSGGSGGSGGAPADSGTRMDAAPEDDAGPTGGPHTVCKAPSPASNPGNTCPSSDPVALKVTTIKSGFNVAVFATQAPGDSKHLFVVERGGTIQVIDLTNGTKTLFLDITSEVLSSSSAGGELGLLGMAFHPDYPRDRRFFVNFTVNPDASDTTNTGKTHIAAFETVLGDPPSGDQSSEQLLLEYLQPQSNHNGGMVAFGPDGCLFIAAGDGGNSNDTGTGHASGGNGQSLDTPLGKILRLDVDAPTSMAPGNLGGAANKHIWDYGVRNPFRFSFDSQSGDLYIGDVGQGAWEEVDVEPAGAGHKNYGWPIAEGTHCLNSGCNMAGLVAPVTDYAHSSGDACVIGGYVYRGSNIPSLRGFYLYGDNGSHNIRAFVWDGSTTCRPPLVLSQRDSISLDNDITSFGQDLAGEVYVVTRSTVYRIDAK